MLVISAMKCHLQGRIKFQPLHWLALHVLWNWKSDKKLPLQGHAKRLEQRVVHDERQAGRFQLAKVKCQR